MLYHVFMLLWGNNFLEGFAIVMIAGTVCGWYFTAEDKYGNRQQKDKLPPPCGEPSATTSAAWLSVAIAGADGRLVLEYVDRQTKGRRTRVVSSFGMSEVLPRLLRSASNLAVNTSMLPTVALLLRGCEASLLPDQGQLAQMGVVSAISCYLLVLGRCCSSQSPA